MMPLTHCLLGMIAEVLPALKSWRSRGFKSLAWPFVIFSLQLIYRLGNMTSNPHTMDSIYLHCG